MLQVNSEARFTAQDVLSHPWVTVPQRAVLSRLCMRAHARLGRVVAICRSIQFQVCTLCLFVPQDDAVMENNMKVEVTGKLQTHFNTAAKHSNSTAAVSVIMVSNKNKPRYDSTSF